MNKKTTEIFKEEVKKLVGGEYLVLGEYNGWDKHIDIEHNICGHSYSVRPNNFLTGRRCPKCFGKNKKTTEIFKEEVKKLVGDEYLIIGEYVNDSTNIKITHDICGYTWKQRPTNFLQGHRCPKCKGSMKRNRENIREEIYELVGNEYSLISEFKSSNEHIVVRHNVCDNEYSVFIGNFRKGHRCPQCWMSSGESKIMNYLKNNNINFIYDKKHTLFGKLRPDFLIPNMNIIIEYDGRQHFEPIDKWGGLENLKKIKKLDNIKNKIAQDNNIQMVRIPYWDYDNIEIILNNIIEDN